MEQRRAGARSGWGGLSLADPSAPHGWPRTASPPRGCPLLPRVAGWGLPGTRGPGRAGRKRLLRRPGPEGASPGAPALGATGRAPGHAGGGRGSGGSYLGHGADVRAGLGAGAATSRPGRGVRARDQVRSTQAGSGGWAPDRRRSPASVSPPAQRVRARTGSEWGPGSPAAGRADCAAAPDPCGAAGRRGPASWWPRAAVRGARAGVSPGDEPRPPPMVPASVPLRGVWGGHHPQFVCRFIPCARFSEHRRCAISR